MSAPAPAAPRAARSAAAAVLDHALLPLLFGGALYATGALLDRRVPNLAVTPIVVSLFTAAVAILERVRPERAEHRPLDRPLWIEAAHFIFSFELGYGLALGACALLARAGRAFLPLPPWPAGWPVALQILLAVLLYEGTSYWQHRLLHRVPRLWRFHALHHSGARLNLVRAVRFHAADLGTAALVSYLPLTLLAAPEDVLTWMGVLLSALGVVQHANLRVRTPAWLDVLVCTPAVHRHHHSIARTESDRNFGNTVMLFDVLFGTFGRPRPAGPDAIGIDGDREPRTFLRQVIDPFLPARTPASPRRDGKSAV